MLVVTAVCWMFAWWFTPLFHHIMWAGRHTQGIGNIWELVASQFAAIAVVPTYIRILPHQLVTPCTRTLTDISTRLQCYLQVSVVEADRHMDGTHEETEMRWAVLLYQPHEMAEHSTCFCLISVTEKIGHLCPVVPMVVADLEKVSVERLALRWIISIVKEWSQSHPRLEVKYQHNNTD